ncbi:MAG: hypothetical protein J2P23_02750 [Microlunatus sp.]|nr:hypothetical protein [Microlunatus sp.]
MSRLELLDQSAPGTVARLFLVICPALVIGTLLGSVLVVLNTSLARTPHAGVLAFVIGGIIGGVAAGLLIGPPLEARRPTVIAAVIDVLVLGAFAIYTLATAARVSGQPIAWAELPLLTLTGAALQVLTMRVIWGLSERQR